MAKRAGLQTEILLTLILLFGAALLLGGVMFLRFTEQQLLDQRLQQAVTATRLTAEILSLRLADRSSEPVIDRLLMSRLETELQVESWWLYDPQLTLLTSINQGLDPPFTSAELRRLMHGEDLLITVNAPNLLTGFFARQSGEILLAVPLKDRQRPLGFFQARFSLQTIFDELWKAQRWVFLFALLYGLVLTGFGLLLLHRNVVRPVKSLLVATKKVSAGDLDSRLETQGPVEIARLAEAFNGMVEALRASRQETSQHIASLEAAYQELSRAQQQLVRSEKMASVGYLAAGMAHEIGNPLGAIIGYLDLLKDDLEKGSNRDLVSHAAEEAGRIERLVRDLLDFAAPSANVSEIFAPAEVISEVVSTLDNQGALKRVRLCQEISPTLPPVRMVRHQLFQVLVNLVLNACDASNEAGVVELQAVAEGGMVAVKVRDFGCGISEDNRRKVFEPFFTTKDPDKGRGLGLAICQRVIEDAGGEIEVSASGQDGTVFVVRLPAAEEDPQCS